MPMSFHDHARAGAVATIRKGLAPHDILLAGRYSEWEHDNSGHAFLAGKRAAEEAWEKNLASGLIKEKNDSRRFRHARTALAMAGKHRQRCLKERICGRVGKTAKVTENTKFLSWFFLRVLRGR